jgi:SNF2 family DNA or RNA helicase
MQVALHKVKPMELPPHMPTRPHDYQLKGASQIDHSCKSKARGILVGDGMGLGKTLQAILNMHLIKGEPGLFLVLCPASLCEQWVNAIHGAFDEVGMIFASGDFLLTSR